MFRSHYMKFDLSIQKNYAAAILLSSKFATFKATTPSARLTVTVPLLACIALMVSRILHPFGRHPLSI